MIIKKFIADTEQEAIRKAKEEMGSDAIVIDIKKNKQRGLKRFFKKNTVEVTVELEDKTTASVSTINAAEEESEYREQGINESDKKMPESNGTDKLDKKVPEKNANLAFMRLIYNQLLDNDVDEKYINQIITEISSSFKKENTLDTVLASAYQRIVLKMGLPKPIELKEKRTKIAFFIGPTGVGKTTTIAKIASDFKLKRDAKVAMVTSDTYRIAAVDQLRTYANILNVPIRVVYTPKELDSAIKELKGYDLILIDTSGRSHKNQEQCEELLRFVNDVVIPEDCDKEIFLVLSATTKYRDLIHIVEVYGKVEKYNLVFTKLDETSTLGNILNIRLKTNAELSYVTLGQTVPEDIGVLNPQKLAKSLLGGVGYAF